MGSKNQFQVYLPDDLADGVREDVVAGRYTVKDVLRDALVAAHEGRVDQVPEASRAIADTNETSEAWVRAVLDDAGFDTTGGVKLALNKAITTLESLRGGLPIPHGIADLAVSAAPGQLSRVVDPETGLDQRSAEWQAAHPVTPIVDSAVPAFYAPAVGEPVPQRAQWFPTVASLDEWLTGAIDRGERVESVSYDPTGGSVLALITDVAAVRL